MKRKDLLLLLVSTFIALLVVEICLRLFTGFPIEGPLANRVPDDRLGYRMDSALPDIDADGFRNTQVSEHPAVVAIGDSHTFGFNVGADESWPAQLAGLMGQDVYSMGLGGYGLLQYRILLEQALEKAPEQIILALYSANDLNDVCGTLLTVETWRRWAEREGFPLDACPPAGEETSSWLLGTALGSAMKHLIGEPLVTTARILTGYESLVLNDGRNRTVIKMSRIRSHSRYMDLEAPQIAAAFELAKELMATTQRKAESRNVIFSVLFVPSKERVFHGYLQAAGHELPAVYHDLVRHEERLLREMSAHLDGLGIAHVDAYSRVRELLDTTGHVYPVKDDGHPLAVGYGAYARAVHENLIP